MGEVAQYTRRAWFVFVYYALTPDIRPVQSFVFLCYALTFFRLSLLHPFVFLCYALTPDTRVQTVKTMANAEQTAVPKQA
jgi:hypothetical protein